MSFDGNFQHNLIRVAFRIMLGKRWQVAATLRTLESAKTLRIPFPIINVKLMRRGDAVDWNIQFRACVSAYVVHRFYL